MTRSANLPSPPIAADRGSAVIVALMATVLLHALGLGLIALTNTEVKIASNFREASEVAYAADAAAEYAISEISRAASLNDVLGGQTTSAFRDGTLMPVLSSGEVLDLPGLTASVQAASDAAVRRGADNPQWRLFMFRALSNVVRSAAARAYVVAWVADDAAEADNDPLVDSNGLIAVRAQAFGRIGLQRTIETTLARNSRGVSILSWREVR